MWVNSVTHISELKEDMMIFYPIKTQYSADFRGFSLGVKTSLRLASLGLDTALKPSLISSEIEFLREKKSILCYLCW